MIRLTSAAASPRGAVRGGKPAIGPIDLTIERGERHLVLGANGAGKTTFLRLLAGLLPAREGRVSWDWGNGASATTEAPPIAPPRGAKGRRPVPAADSVTLWPHLAALFETPDPQFLADTVEADVAFGLEGLGLPRETIRERVAETLDAFGIAGFAARDPRTLSAGEKARALLAAGLAARPACLLLDQTLAHLDPGSRRALEARLTREAEGGAFALVRTHQEAEAPFDGERLHILERGVLGDVRAVGAAGVGAARHLPLPPALRLSAALESLGRWRGPLAADTGELLAELAPLVESSEDRRPRERRSERGAPREAAFALQSAVWGPAGAPPLFDGFDLEGARGEIVALVGRSGSGKSSLLRLLGGLDAPREGVAWRAEPRSDETNAAALALEYPERQLIGRTVLEDVSMSLWVRGRGRPEREKLAVRALASVGISHERFGSRIPATLSEGEKRRVALAGLLVEPARLLLFDEPTAGLDPEGRRALRATLDALRARERTIVVASHDLDFVHAVADRVVILAREEGGAARIVCDALPGEAFRDERVLAEAGIPAPDVVVLGDALRAAGLLAADAPFARDADALVEQLERHVSPAPASDGGGASGSSRSGTGARSAPGAVDGTGRGMNARVGAA